MADKQIDMVNHPPHYNTGNIEVIDFIEDQGLDFRLGSVVKYVCRAKHKGTELEDLRKARWYLSRWLNSSEGQATFNATLAIEQLDEHIKILERDDAI